MSQGLDSNAEQHPHVWWIHLNRFTNGLVEISVPDGHTIKKTFGPETAQCFVVIVGTRAVENGAKGLPRWAVKEHIEDGIK
ncbi:hypothetical protein NXS19_013520 [Fusarium pseudograminearum]|nr:hypothetical protein NXS19_013520 [Fusarium pseudograminearum]